MGQGKSELYDYRVMDAAEDLLAKEADESPQDASEGLPEGSETASEPAPEGASEQAPPPSQAPPGEPENPQSSENPQSEVKSPPQAPVPAFGTPIPVKATTGGLKSGTIVTGTVTAVSPREMELDLGEGRTAVIGSRHWTSGLEVDLTGEVRKGESVSAAVLVREDHKNRIVLSRSWGLQLKGWQEASEAMESGRLVSGTVTGAGKPGWTVDIGIRAFVPASLTGDEDPETLIGKTTEFKVVEVKQSQSRCILSRTAARKALERRVNRKRLEELKAGDLVQAVVTEVHGGGAVVRVDGRFVSHMRRNELSWSHVRRTEAVVKVGDELQVKVLETHPRKMKISVSLRLGEDPFLRIDRSKRYEGTVKSLTLSGAYVSIEIGDADGGDERLAVEGLVAKEELVEYPIRHPSNVVVPGDRVVVQVIGFSRRSRQLDLSVNQAMLVLPPESPGSPEGVEDSQEEVSTEATEATEETTEAITEEPTEAITEEPDATEATTEEPEEPTEAAEAPPGEPGAD